MQERLRKAVTENLEKWRALDGRRRARVIGVVIAVILSLAVTIYLMSRPVWRVLTDNRSQSEIAQIQKALDEMGYKYKLGAAGSSIMIEEKNLTQAKVNLSTTEIVTQGDFTFKDAMDFSGMGSTEMVKRASFKRLAEVEIARSILAFDGIASASVNLAIPETNSYFIENNEKPSAGIAIVARKTLDPAAGEAIARLVARSVVGLEIENIEITDQNMNSVFSGIKKNQSAATAEDEVTGAKKRELEGKIQNSLKPLFDDVQIVSNLVFDWDRAKTVSRVYEPPISDSETGALSSSITESQKVTGGAASNEMGLGANDAQTPEYNVGGTGNGTASVKSEENNYIYNETESVMEKSVGALAPELSNMFISCYRYVNHYQRTLEDNGELEGTNWETYKNTLTARRIEIDPDLTENIRRGTGIENVSIIGYEVPVFVDKIVSDAGPDRKFLAVMGVLAALIALLAFGVFKTAAPVEGIEGIESSLESESAILSSRIEREKEEELTKMDLEYKKDSDTKVKIEKFVDEKPEAVAQLLRNWIQDD